MKNDIYSKVVLTIIAFSLVVLIGENWLKHSTVVQAASAATAAHNHPDWEYIIITRTRPFPGKDSGGNLYYDAGEWNSYWATSSYDTKGKELQAPVDIAKLIASIGHEGWELVAVEPISAAASSGSGGGFSMGGATTDERWIFKRQVN